MTRYIHQSAVRWTAALALVCLAGPAAAQTALLEIEKADATRLMSVNDDAGFLLLGTAGEGTIPASGAGIRFMWYPGKAALRAGEATGTEWDDDQIGEGSAAFGKGNAVSGDRSMAVGLANLVTGGNSFATGNNSKATNGNSVAMGNLTTASGFFALATGSATTASGNSSTAMGSGTLAGGEYGTALGRDTEAAGNNSTAMGFESRAVGLYSMATGFRTTAGGERSTAMGSYVGTLGTGGFAYGDASTGVLNLTALQDEFVVRASGGFKFRTSPNLSTGCNLPAGSGTFECTSSRLAKTGFEDLDPELVLEKLAALHIQRWHYRGTGSAHVGPTAEDFHAAFGLGGGPTAISLVDADGIGMVAAQALARRTDGLRAENVRLRTELAELRAELAALAERVR